MKPNHKHYYKPTTMMPPINPPPPRLNVDEWIAKQEAESEDLQKMYNFVARQAMRRYESFLAAGFAAGPAFELTKIYVKT